MTVASRQRVVVLAFALAAVIVVADQISKWWILDHVMTPPRVIEVTSFFNLVMAWNRGVSFGMFGGGAMPPWALSALAGVIVIGLCVWMVNTPQPRIALGVGLIVGGAAGNVIDRMRFGAVADFLDFHVLGYHWPAFNVADMGITLGAAVLVLDSLFAKPEGPTNDVQNQRTAKDE